MRKLYVFLLALGEAVCLLLGMNFVLGTLCFSGVKLLKLLGYYQAAYPYLPYLAATAISLSSLFCFILLFLSWLNGSTISDYLDNKVFKVVEDQVAVHSNTK